MKISSLETSVFVVPTEEPEADGTFEWRSTTVVVVEVAAGSGLRGLGYTYGASAAAAVAEDVLSSAVQGREPDDHPAIWSDMLRACRNIGRQGIAATAISAVDAALWDLRAKAAGLPLFELLGARRREVPVYGSGGFTSMSDRHLVEQLQSWTDAGIPRVKMKIGEPVSKALRRVELVREALGPDPEIFVDANGAYSAKEAIGLIPKLQDLGVTYFEEPVSSDHLSQLAEVRAQSPIDIAAGEYGWDPWYFDAMLGAGAVDILQADASRCCGITGWIQAASLAGAAGVPFSAHCCPSLHLHAACAVPAIAHLEYFADHVRVERLLFDGSAEVGAGGVIAPDRTRPGLGLEIKRQDARRYAA